jgi:CubicO group peptidase (beta-lactamase class C family)
LAQLVVEDVTRKPFAAYMKAAVFDPLGMKDTRFGNPELARGAVAYHTDETGLGVVRAGYPNLAAAALYTTIGDFGKLVIEDMTRGKAVAGVLAPADFDAMESPAPGSGGTYGLGYFIETTPGSGFLVGHDGSDVGWNSMYRALPKSGDAFIMFTSGSHGLSAYISPLCGWLGWKTGVDRKDYCVPSSSSVMVTLFREGEAAAVHRYDDMKRARADFDVPEPYWAFLARGMIARHNVAAALSLFRLIAALHPASATAFANLGAGYVAAQAYDAARASYRKALEIDPKLDRAKAALDSVKGVAP